MNWTEALRQLSGIFAALGRLLAWLFGPPGGKDAGAAEAEKRKDSAHEAAARLDPDVLGDRLRRGLRRDGK
jgi:hypothetical protein